MKASSNSILRIIPAEDAGEFKTWQLGEISKNSLKAAVVHPHQIVDPAWASHFESRLPDPLQDPELVAALQALAPKLAGITAQESNQSPSVNEAMPSISDTLASPASSLSALDDERIAQEESLRLEQEKQLELLKEQAYAEAFERGLQEGFAKGQENGFNAGMQAAEEVAQARFDPLWQSIDHWVEDFQKSLNNLDDVLASQLAHLAFDMAKAMVPIQARAHPEALLPLIDESLSKLRSDLSTIKVRVHPDDLSVLEGFLTSAYKKTHFIWISDASLAQGGCILETPYTQIDLTVATRQERLQLALGIQTS